MKKRAHRSHLFERLPQTLSTDLKAALRDRREWNSYEGGNASFVIALSRARWAKGDHKVCRSYVQPVLVPIGLHKQVRRYRILHVRRTTNRFTADKVLTWVAFKKLKGLGDLGPRVWRELPSFVNTAVLKNHLARVKNKIEDIPTNLSS